jgi:hypothetical protein
MPKNKTRFAGKAKRVRESIRFAALAVFVRIGSFNEATDPRARKLGSNRRESGHYRPVAVTVKPDCGNVRQATRAGDTRSRRQSLRHFLPK